MKEKSEKIKDLSQEVYLYEEKTRILKAKEAQEFEKKYSDLDDILSEKQKQF